MSKSKFSDKMMIAYRTTDCEGDIWSETAFLFESDEDVNDFFTKDNKLLLEIFTDGKDKFLNDFKIHNDNPAKRISCVTFNTEHAGDVEIYEMSLGYIIEKQK